MKSSNAYVYNDRIGGQDYNNYVDVNLDSLDVTQFVSPMKMKSKPAPGKILTTA